MVTRVLHLVPALFGDAGVYGGAERYALELARHMAERVPTTLVAFGSAARRLRDGKLRIRVLGPAWHVRGHRFNPLHAGLIPEVAKATIIHCHQQHVLASSLTAALARISGRKVFVSDLGGGGWDVSTYASTDRWYHGHMHISEYSRTLAGHKDWNRAMVILGGVDVERFHPGEGARNGPALFVGRLMPHKGVNDLVDAVPPDVPLELIGRPYDVQFTRDLRRRAEGKNVVFRHDCTDDDVIRAYQRAMCVVLPSVYRSAFGGETSIPELLGQTLIEGMACGAPAICTNVASMPEVVVNGVTGFVVPPNDPPALREKLMWLKRHPDRAADMGRAGRQRVLERFTWHAVVDRCLAAYDGQ
jgi:glycosyltransferase involved in cell wall biosynthesis